MGYYKVRVNVKDQHNSPVVGAKATLTKDGRGQGYPNSFTDSNGNAYFYDVVSGIKFMYKVVAPSGYSCVTCAKYHTLSDKDIWTQMEMKKADAPNFDLHVLCEDQNNNKLQNVAITINNVHRGYTSSSGTFSVSLPGNQQYDVKGVKSGYENGFDSVYLSSSKVANLTLKYSDPFVCSEGAKKDYESCFDGTHVYKTVCRDNKWIPTGDTCPEEGALDCFCDVQVTDENDNNLNAKVCIPGAVIECKLTGTDGVGMAFELKQNTTYTATATKDGYSDWSGFGSMTFTNPNSDYNFIALRLKKEVETCPDVDAKFEATAPWRDAAQTEFAIGETIEVGDTSISDEEIVKAVWNWGDGSSTSGSAGFWNFISANTFQAEHEYSTPGKKTIVYTATNKCGSKDTQSFYINILSAAEIETYITAPSSAKVNEGFTVRVNNSDEGKKFSIKIFSLLLDDVIGQGTINSSGYVDIECVIDKVGDYEIYGYDPGSTLIPGGYITPKREISITETGEAPDPMPDDIPEGKDNFQIAVSKLVMTGDIEIQGRAPVGSEVKIMGKKSWLGFDALAFDTVLATVITDSEGEFETTIELDEVGVVDVYGKITKTALDEAWWAKYISWIPGAPTAADWLVRDWYTETHTLYVLNWMIITALGLMVALILEKQYNFVGIFKK